MHLGCPRERTVPQRLKPATAVLYSTAEAVPFQNTDDILFRCQSSNFKTKQFS
jgi:hypothetical protein